MAVTAEQLKRILEYDPETGCFKWRDTFEAGVCCARIRPQPKPGDVVKGHQMQLGYLHISINGVRFLMHRLVWLYVYGRLPAKGMQIDHVNGERNDNRLVNLRTATVSQNRMNSRRQRNNSSGFRGVHWHAQSRRWRASVYTDNQRSRSKLFANVEDAVKWRDALAAELHGEFVTLNPPAMGGSHSR